MTNAGKASLAAIWANAVLDDEMTSLDLDSNAETEESKNSLSRPYDFPGIAVVTVLGYGLSSCHRS
jgi:hypothetical protein